MEEKLWKIIKEAVVVDYANYWCFGGCGNEDCKEGFAYISGLLRAYCLISGRSIAVVQRDNGNKLVFFEMYIENGKRCKRYIYEFDVTAWFKSEE